MVALRNDDDARTVNASDLDATTTSTSTLDPVVVSTTTTPGLSTTTAVKGKTTTTVKAVTDDDPESYCATTAPAEPTPVQDDWATYWQTKPEPNSALHLTICIDDRTPAAGQLVTLTVTADDPDAEIGDGDCDIYVTWESNPGSLCRDTVIASDEPRPIAARKHGHVVKNFTHTYNSAGEPNVDVSAWSGPGDGHRYPYNSYANIELKVIVHGR